MSAFYLGHAHITALIAYAVRKRLFANCSTLQGMDETQAGKVLLAENARSMMARYPGDDQEEYTIDRESYKYSPTAKDMRRPPVEIIKACNCYDYQACETGDYRSTQAAKMVDLIRDEAITSLPGYDAAPWSIR